jgi:hypothetical protein
MSVQARRSLGVDGCWLSGYRTVVSDPDQIKPDVADDKDHHPVGASPEEAREAAEDGPDDDDAQSGPGSATSRPGPAGG